MAIKKAIETVSGVTTTYQRVTSFYVHCNGIVRFNVERYVSDEKRKAGAQRVEERIHEFYDPEIFKKMQKLTYEKALELITELAGGEAIYEPESVTLDKTAATLKPGETVQLAATVLPAESTDKTVRWTSGDPSVTVVDGLITVAADAEEGATTITCETAVRGKIASCTVTIEARKVEE